MSFEWKRKGTKVTKGRLRSEGDHGWPPKGGLSSQADPTGKRGLKAAMEGLKKV